MVIDELGPLELRVIAAAFLYRWRIAAYFVVGALLAGGIVWVLPRAWVSVASFIPETSNSSQVSGIAADLGIGTGASVGESPDFYVELLRSDDVLRSIAPPLSSTKIGATFLSCKAHARSAFPAVGTPSNVCGR